MLDRFGRRRHDMQPCTHVACCKLHNQVAVLQCKISCARQQCWFLLPAQSARRGPLWAGARTGNVIIGTEYGSDALTMLVFTLHNARWAPWAVR